MSLTKEVGHPDTTQRMGLTKFEKIVYQGCPWFFSVVMVACGIIVSSAKPDETQGVILICAGLICMSLYCISSLLVKLIEK